MSKVNPWAHRVEPHLPPWYDNSVIYAVQALSRGQANEGQQKLAWTWLMFITAASDQFPDQAYRPGSEGRRSTDFALGKHWVGLAFRKLLALIPAEKQTPQTEQDLRIHRLKTRRKAA